VTNPVNFDAATHSSYTDGSGIARPSVTWILAQSGLCDFSFVEQEVRDRAMQRGKSVHWMTRLEDEHSLNFRTVPKALRPFRKAYRTWKQNSGFVPEIIEEPFISPLGFAGTPDRVGSFPPTTMFPCGSRAVVDLKTGSICDWTRFQLLLYAVGVTEKIWQAKMLRRIAVALKADGRYSVKEFPLVEWDHDLSVAMMAKKRTEELCLAQL
jgi:hypothetical protein